MGGPCGVGAVWSRELVVGGVADNIPAFGVAISASVSASYGCATNSRAGIDIANVHRVNS